VIQEPAVLEAWDTLMRLRAAIRDRFPERVQKLLEIEIMADTYGLRRLVAITFKGGDGRELTLEGPAERQPDGSYAISQDLVHQVLACVP
jgi:hypothetical protein